MKNGPKFLLAGFVSTLAIACGPMPADPSTADHYLLDTDELAWVTSLSDAQKQGVVDFTNQATRDQLDDECGLQRDAANSISRLTRKGDSYVAVQQIADQPDVGLWNMHRLYDCAAANGYVAGQFTLTSDNVSGVAQDGAKRFGLAGYASSVCEWAAGEMTVCIEPCVRHVTCAGIAWITELVNTWVGTTYSSRDEAIQAAANAMCQNSECGTGGYSNYWADPTGAALNSVIGCAESY